MISGRERTLSAAYLIILRLEKIIWFYDRFVFGFDEFLGLSNRFISGLENWLGFLIWGSLIEGFDNFTLNFRLLVAEIRDILFIWHLYNRPLFYLTNFKQQKEFQLFVHSNINYWCFSLFLILPLQRLFQYLPYHGMGIFFHGMGNPTKKQSLNIGQNKIDYLLIFYFVSFQWKDWVRSRRVWAGADLVEKFLAILVESFGILWRVKNQQNVLSK